MGEAPVSAVTPLPWGQAVVATVIVLLLLAATLWVLRKGLTRRASAGAAMAVHGSLALGERRSLVVVDVEGRRLLLGLAPGQVRLITELGAAPPPLDRRPGGHA